jgi:hypothetical protein
LARAAGANAVMAFKKIFEINQGRSFPEKTLKTLELCIKKLLPTFEPQQLSNLMHAYAKHKFVQRVRMSDVARSSHPYSNICISRYYSLTHSLTPLTPSHSLPSSSSPSRSLSLPLSR